MVVWLLSPLSLLGAALLASQRGWGLFNWVSAPDVVAVTISWLVLDLVLYLEHRLKHGIPLLCASIACTTRTGRRTSRRPCVSTRSRFC
jgi:sterol desaturase/sphingolipid hydroxylase (fatty acid hydroxylase superfamily)